MPTSHRIAQMLLYAFLFSSLVFLSICLPVAQWVSVKFGTWVMIGGLVSYAVITVGSVRLLNKINHTWSDVDIPLHPSDRSLMGMDDTIERPPQVEVGRFDTPVVVSMERRNDQK